MNVGIYICTYVFSYHQQSTASSLLVKAISLGSPLPVATTNLLAVSDKTTW